MSSVPLGGMDGSVSTRAVSPGSPVCGVSTGAAGRSGPLLVPPSSPGATNTRRGSGLVSGLQPSRRQVCAMTCKMHSSYPPCPLESLYPGVISTVVTELLFLFIPNFTNVKLLL